MTNCYKTLRGATDAVKPRLPRTKFDG